MNYVWIFSGISALVVVGLVWMIWEALEPRKAKPYDWKQDKSF